jgi:hypothetical protein
MQHNPEDPPRPSQHRYEPRHRLKFVDARNQDWMRCMATTSRRPNSPPSNDSTIAERSCPPARRLSPPTSYHRPSGTWREGVGCVPSPERAIWLQSRCRPHRMLRLNPQVPSVRSEKCHEQHNHRSHLAPGQVMRHSSGIDGLPGVHQRDLKEAGKALAPIQPHPIAVPCDAAPRTREIASDGVFVTIGGRSLRMLVIHEAPEELGNGGRTVGAP